MTKIPFSGNTQFSDWLGYAGRTPYQPFQAQSLNTGMPHPNQTGMAQMQPAATMNGMPSPMKRAEQLKGIL
jgi:hypothetical protein